MRKPFLLLSSALVSVMLAIPAQAQNPTLPDSNRADIARIDVRFTALEERLRQMQGRIEEVEFENRRLREKLDVFQQDAELRFSELEGGNAPVANVPADSPAPAAPKDTQPTPAPASATETQVLKLPNENVNSFESSRDHYNHAFRLLNQTQYEEAGKSFEQFVQSYPKDPLVGNAYYWAGETYYVRQSYVQAADYFRRGYESMPNGPKAGDNLLKLAMTLSAMDRNTESCVVLKQVSAKFGTNSTTLRNKAEAERNRIGCR
jgi:tol-pal system protein YbgF